MQITIDGNLIPPRLSDLVARGRWQAPLQNDRWRTLVPADHVVMPSLYPLDQADGMSLWESEAGDDFLGVEDEKVKPGTIDPKRAIIIGDLGPERLLVLDLRVSETNPSVCAFLPREDDDSCWVVVAPCLEDFIEALGLDD